MSERGIKGERDRKKGGERMRDRERGWDLCYMKC